MKGVMIVSVLLVLIGVNVALAYEGKPKNAQYEHCLKMAGDVCKHVKTCNAMYNAGVFNQQTNGNK